MVIRRDGLDILLAKLNTSGIQQKNTPLYEVIAELIRQVKILRDEDSGGTSIINNLTTVQQFIDVFGDGGGSEEGMVVPGPVGPTGPIGPTGQEGPPFPALIYLESDDPEDLLPIPGPQGIQGVAGATGATGNQTIGFVIEADLPEDPIVIPGRDGTGATGWTLLYTQVADGSINLYDFPNLSAYSEILVIFKAITKSASQTLLLRVSTDNGATFLTASGDYVSFTGTGAEVNDTSILLHTTASALARSGFVIIRLFNNGSTPKSSQSTSGTPNYIIPTTTALNAIRVTASGAGLLNAGTIYVYGRT